MKMMFSSSEPLFPDLSLQISPPPSMFPDAAETNKESTTSVSDSGGSGSDLSLGFNVPEPHPLVKKEAGHELVKDQRGCSRKPQLLGRGFKRGGLKRSARAPRMRWTTSLHAHFVHVVQLLGGHERATPKSVLELMNVNDLTLAHVKSHLQMYRTVKSTDKGSAGGQVQSHAAIKQRMEEVTGTCDQKPPATAEVETEAEESRGGDGISYSHQTPLLVDSKKCGYSWLRLMETNATTELRHRSVVTNCQQIESKVGGHMPAFQSHVLSGNVKGRSTTLTLLDSSCLSSDLDQHQAMPLLDLDFTLGRPSRCSDGSESSNELTLLNC
ncbi:hypothetical protein MLD38_002081 [Melastoma candidum]|uniref:Uncharacterized protein n=1 Tax=Melastoma candidum TaxID=119954 RepID=A0ACB9SJA7_9MYRT|nr:hypothetical protein MLD38_002081 [Melastoma candidum]